MWLGIGGWPVWPITTFPWNTRKVRTIPWLISISCIENCLPEEEVEEVLHQVEIPAPGVKAMLDNANTPITERAEGGDNVLPVRACLAETLSACPVKYTTLQVVDWKKA